MDRLSIRGGRRLEGSVQIRGAKNAALPQIAAALLSCEPLEIGNVPDISDISTMMALLQELGAAATRGPGGTLTLDARDVRSDEHLMTSCGACGPASSCWVHC